MVLVSVDVRGTGASFGTHPGPWSPEEQQVQDRATCKDTLYYTVVARSVFVFFSFDIGRANWLTKEKRSVSVRVKAENDSKGHVVCACVYHPEKRLVAIHR